MRQDGFALLRAQVRSAEELDAEILVILRDGVLHDPELDRVFRDLPLNVALSFLRAYGYDVLGGASPPCQANACPCR